MRIIARNTVNYGQEEYALILKAAAGFDRPPGGVARFEAAFSRAVGSGVAVAAPSASAGLVAVLRAMGLETPGEVVVPAYAHRSTATAVRLAGLTPVFADVDPETYTVSSAEVERAVTAEARAIVVTHVFGTPADLDPLLSTARARRIPLVADCAHALGAKYRGRQVGSIEDAAVFSFGTGKAVCCLGGGMVVCRDGGLADAVRRELKKIEGLERPARAFVAPLANAVLSHGWIYKGVVFPPLFALSLLDRARLDDRFAGRGGREPPDEGGGDRHPFTDLQAELGILQLARLEEHNRARAEAARRLMAGITNPSVVLPREIIGRESSFLCLPMRCADAARAARDLVRRGIDTRPDYLSYEGARHDLRNRILYLPNQPGLSEEDLDAIVGGVNALR